MGKQKMVVKLTMEDEKKRSKAMKTAVGFLGVISVEVQGEANDRLMVIGDGVDLIKLTKTLRRKMGGHVDLVSVGAVEEKEKKENKDEEVTWPPYEYRYVPPPSVFEYPHLYQDYGYIPSWY
ncbi:hypothetical protein J5N97_007024 [Dioscorea zingiberensis]|uniref:Uncharacterized protein n=1 Tax=Dioscorea zingiberensis TaxID=325984 RepID=A0A9D5HU33_9LILI|nr:hypothetical protein J5N97_007024 [Dioscorea zingiberensis]